MPGAPHGVYVPEILPPREDGVFKTILTHPTAPPILRDVLEGVLEVSVSDVTVRNEETPIADVNEKRARFDVNCKIDGDKQAEIEMQSEHMKGDSAPNGHGNICGRAVLNLCKLHASQPGRGARYDSLIRSYQIIFCNYTVFPADGDYLRRFSFRTADGAELSNAANILFIELTKLAEILKKPAGEMTQGEMWAVFFKYADDPKHRRLKDEIATRKEEVNMAMTLLKSISKDERERALYLSRQMFQMDLEHNLTVSRDEGRMEGLKEGEARGRMEGLKEGEARGRRDIVKKGRREGESKGRREGEAKGRRDIAKNLLQAGLPPADIAKATGLSAAEIESLRAGG